MALGFSALAAQSQTFTGTIVEQRPTGSLVLATDGPASSVYANARYPTPLAVLDANFQGDASTGFSRVNVFNFGEDMAVVPGPATVVSSLLFKQWVTNPTSTAQNVSFNFEIPASLLTVNLTGFSFGSLDALAAFSGSISWGGVNVWDVDLGLTAKGTPAGGTHFSSSLTQSASASGFVATPFLPANVAPGATITDRAYVASSVYNGLLSLGTLNPGETRELIYELDASASYSYVGKTYAGIYGGGGDFVSTGGYDPFGIDFDPATNGITFTPAGPGNGVPEPGGMALAGIAAFGVWATGGRRRSRVAETVPLPETVADSV